MSTVDLGQFTLDSLLQQRIDELMSEVDALKAERDLLLAIMDRFVACFEPGDRRSIVSANFDAVWDAIDAWKRQQEGDS